MSKDSLFFSKNQIDKISQRLNQLLSNVTQTERQLILCPESGSPMKWNNGCGDGSCSRNCTGGCSGGMYDSFGSRGCGDKSCSNSCYGNAAR